MKERDMRYMELTKARDCLPLSQWDYVDLLELHTLLCLEVDERNEALKNDAANMAKRDPSKLLSLSIALKKFASYATNDQKKDSTYSKDRIAELEEANKMVKEIKGAGRSSDSGP